MRHIVIAMVLFLTGCFGKPLERFKDKDKAPAVAGLPADGAVTSAINGAEGGTVTGAESLGGASVAFAAGSLAVDTSVTVEEGADLVNDATAAELGLPEGFGAGAAPVVVSSSTPTDAVTPFTVSLPLPPPDQALQGDQYELVVVLFKYFIAAENRYEIGVWTRDKFAIEGAFAKVPTLYFGFYQAVFLKVLLPTSIKMPSTTPIVTKAQDVAAAPVTWSAVEIVSSLGMTAKMRATVTGLPGISGCVMVADRDKVQPWDIVSPKLTVAEHEFTVTEAGVYAARFECVGTDGRPSPPSDWSASITLQALVPPVILTVAPATVNAAGGTVLTITGSGFKAGAKVHLTASQQCGTVQIESATKLKCTTPVLAAAAYDVKVTVEDLSSTKINAITAKAAGLMALHSGDPDLGGRFLGATATTRTLTFKNNGAMPVTGVSTTFTTSDAELVRSSDTCQAAGAIAPAGTCTVIFTYSVSGVAEGHSGTFTMDYVDGFGGAKSIADVTVSAATIRPALLKLDVGTAYDFGVIASGYSRTRPVVVTNTGDVPATDILPSGLSLHFSLGAGGTCVTELNAGDTCVYDVTYMGEAALDGPSSSQTLTVAYENGVAPATPVTLALSAASSTKVEVTSLAIGAYHTCARLTSDVVKCWGKNHVGQLGHDGVASLGTGTTDLDDVGGVVPLPEKAVSVFSGADASHTCAISDTKRLYCWGLNDEGQLGLGDEEPRGNGDVAMNTLAPVDLGTGLWAKDVAVGGDFTCAVVGSVVPAENDRLKCWGGNAFGQLGYNDLFVRGDAADEMGDDLDFVDFDNLSDPDTVANIAAGAFHVCAVLLFSPELQCWGDNTYKQLGRGVDDAFKKLPGSVGLGQPATDVAAGTKHTCVLDATGVRCWGNDFYGQIGNGVASTGDVGGTALSIPAALSLGAAPTGIVAGGHTNCAALTGGAVRCWGDNATGNWGTSNSTTAYAEASASTNIDMYVGATPHVLLTPNPILATGKHTCVKISDGDRSLRCLGNNSHGQVGLGVATPLIHAGAVTINNTQSLVGYD